MPNACAPFTAVWCRNPVLVFWGMVDSTIHKFILYSSMDSSAEWRCYSNDLFKGIRSSCRSTLITNGKNVAHEPGVANRIFAHVRASTTKFALFVALSFLYIYVFLTYIRIYMYTQLLYISCVCVCVWCAVCGCCCY